MSKKFALDSEFTTKQVPAVAYLIGYTEVCEKPMPSQCKAFTSVRDCIQSMFSEENNSIFYAHNLRADYSYICSVLHLDGFFANVDIKESIFGINRKVLSVKLTRDGKTIELRDSYSLFYAPLWAVQKGWNKIWTHKLDTGYYEYIPWELDYDYPFTSANDCAIVYNSFRHYFLTDILGLAEALHYRLAMGRGKLTTSSDAKALLKEFINEDNRRIKDAFDNRIFPRLSLEQDAALRPYYKGGFCYVNPRWRDKIIEKPVNIYDVNSMYPAIMRDKPLPIGKPKAFIGEPPYGKLFVCTIYIDSCEVKPNKQPFITNGRVNSYFSRDYLSEIDYAEDEQYHYLHLTNMELELFKETYRYDNLKYVGGFWFSSSTNQFKHYVEHFREIKETSTGALREGAKRFLVAPSGKLGQKPTQDQYKLVMVERILHFAKEEGKPSEKAWYLPASLFITAYGRVQITRQINKVGQATFVYCDTDSCHTIGNCDTLFPIHQNKLGYWKREKTSDRSRYVRVKRYFHEYKKPAYKFPNRLGFASLSRHWEDSRAYTHEFKCAGIPARYAKGIETCEDFHEGRQIECLIGKFVEGGYRLSPLIRTI